MAKSRKYNGRAMGIGGGAAIGVAIALALSILGAALIAWLILSGKVQTDSIGYILMVLIPVSVLIGCAISWRLIRHRRWLVSGAVCGGYYLALLLTGMAFGGVREGLITTAVLSILGGGLSLIAELVVHRSGVRRPKIRV